MKTEKDYIKEERQTLKDKKEGCMSLRHVAGFVAILAGMLLAVCTADGSDNEILMRFVGVGIVAVGALMCGILGGRGDE